MAEENLPHVEEKATTALIILDMVNDMEFEDRDYLFPHALKAAEQIARLKATVKDYGIPVIYVNDNYGRWQSDFQELVAHCKRDDVKGKPITEKIEPESDDYFVLKPQFSGFFATPLDLLLEYLDVKTLIITGVAGNMCVHFTANDAYMRHYQLFVPADCTASNDEHDNQLALDLMNHVLNADISKSSDYQLEHIITQAKQHYDKNI
ncbi:cysteine hydrolase [Salibacterium salarium]|uniref:Cysteine hydrolase n=1 Tax=Salibacterium salarium TaxID=284579 RepID=A0A3R9Q5P2_9BACI|nr:isochorismatase family cysteine hydrolase [Salibacterium salarium]RSL34156.1 cysteine hydrolase [Salibacterium salarium]